MYDNNGALVLYYYNIEHDIVIKNLVLQSGHQDSHPIFTYANYLTSFWLSDLICKMEVMIITSKVVVKNE
jgi:hypothetical protein